MLEREESAHAIRKRWDDHVRNLDAQLESEGEASKCIKDNVCMVRGKAKFPCTITCGSEQYVKVLRPEDSGALISLKT